MKCQKMMTTMPAAVAAGLPIGATTVAIAAATDVLAIESTPVESVVPTNHASDGVVGATGTNTNDDSLLNRWLSSAICMRRLNKLEAIP